MMTVDVNCPVCGHPLPPVPVLPEDVVRAGDAVTVQLDASLTPAWWARVRLSHPRCTGGRDDMPLAATA